MCVCMIRGGGTVFDMICRRRLEKTCGVVLFFQFKLGFWGSNSGDQVCPESPSSYLTAPLNFWTVCIVVMHMNYFFN